MAQYRPRRRGLIKYVGNLVENSKDLVDDILDYARDVDDDVRRTVRRTVDYDRDGRRDHDDDRGDDRGRYRSRDRDDDRDGDDDGFSASDITAVQRTLAELTEKVNELASLQQQGEQRQAGKRQGAQPTEREKPASTSR